MKGKIDWGELCSIFVAFFCATTVKQIVFANELLKYSIFKDFLIFTALYIPVYLFMYFLQKKLKNK